MVELQEERELLLSQLLMGLGIAAFGLLAGIAFSAAKKSFVFKTYLVDDSIRIESKDGVVTLTGTVALIEHRELAQDTVEGLPAVVRMDNQMTIEITATAAK